YFKVLKEKNQRLFFPIYLFIQSISITLCIEFIENNRLKHRVNNQYNTLIYTLFPFIFRKKNLPFLLLCVYILHLNCKYLPFLPF
ncbi:hypothetical protein BDB01DRAFT_736617, partial [Pilobolus umbonatus]